MKPSEWLAAIAIVLSIVAIGFGIVNYIQLSSMRNIDTAQDANDISETTDLKGINQLNDSEGDIAQNGPKAHQVYTAVSDDGVTWSKVAEVLDEASVPQAVMLDDGSVRIYYVDASQQPENMNCADLNPEYTEATVRTCTVDGLPEGKKMVDPTIVRLADGRYRLYFYEALIKGKIDSEDDHEIGSAISIDGIKFDYEGVVFTYEGLVDPDVFWDGEQWRMYVFSLTDHETVVAVSEDGADFTYEGPLGIGAYGTTAPVQIDDGTYRMYAFSQTPEKAVVSFTTTDFETWELEEGERIQPQTNREITDPQVVQLEDSSWLMVYKESDIPQKTQRPNTNPANTGEKLLLE